jgi:hypothetical protein
MERVQGKILLNNKRGAATTEFIIVSFVFVMVFAAFAMIGDTILFKIKSLITARSLAFNLSEDEQGVSTKRKVIRVYETPSMILDKCLSPELADRPSRVKAEVKLEAPGFFKEFIPVPEIEDQYLVARDTWKGLSPEVISALVAACPGQE